MLKVGLDLFSLSTSRVVPPFLGRLLTGDLGDAGLSLPKSPNDRGDLVKLSPLPRGFSEDCERKILRRVLKLLNNWRRTGIEATMMPTFCSALSPRSA